MSTIIVTTIIVYTIISDRMTLSEFPDNGFMIFSFLSILKELSGGNNYGRFIILGPGC